MGDWKVRLCTAGYGMLTFILFTIGGFRMSINSEYMKELNSVKTTNINEIA